MAGEPTAAPVISCEPRRRGPCAFGASTPAPVALAFSVSGELYFEELRCRDAEDNEDVFKAAIADLCGVDAAGVSMRMPSAMAMRRRVACGGCRPAASS